MNANRTTPHPILRRVAAGLGGAAVALTVFGGAAASALSATSPPPVGPIVTAVDEAVADLVGPTPLDALGSLPAGFGETMGYLPTVEGARPVNPTGSCSSPIPLPDRFEPVCRSHDFGYDLLRFAAATGLQTSPWARRALDDMLIAAMHETCTDPLCHAAAAVADAGLAANSWRQEWRAPAAESTGDVLGSLARRTVDTIGRVR